MSVLVTGGAGYIGSHVVRLLRERGDDVVVVDDLSTGVAARIGDLPLVELDLAGTDAVEVLAQAMADHAVRQVIHFAARKQVGESVTQPARYYAQNIGGMANLLLAMERTGVDRLVFSSSAAVYGQPDTDRVREDDTTAPINPYGETKLAGEWLAQDAERAWGLRQVSLRYFNVAGAGWPDLADTGLFNLIPIVLDRLSRGQRPVVFGEDYATADGTCIRDYVHVLDLAEAHLAALDSLDADERAADVFNIGTGEGSSVREVLAEIGRAAGSPLDIEYAPRRAGDPAVLVASPERINTVLQWRATRTLRDIVDSAWTATHPDR